MDQAEQAINLPDLPFQMKAIQNFPQFNPAVLINNMTSGRETNTQSIWPSQGRRVRVWCMPIHPHWLWEQETRGVPSSTASGSKRGHTSPTSSSWLIHRLLRLKRKWSHFLGRQCWTMLARVHSKLFGIYLVISVYLGQSKTTKFLFIIRNYITRYSPL